MSSLKRFVFTLFFVVTFSLLSQIGVADTTDDAQLFTPDQIQQLNQLATKIDQQAKAKAYVATTATNQGDEKSYATNYLRDKVGNDNNGVVFLIDLSNRGYRITTSGNMTDFLTDKRIDAIQEQVEPYLRNGQYFEAAKTYLEQTSYFVEQGVPGGHYYVDEKTGKITRYKVLTPIEVLLALVVSFIISALVFFSVKSRYQLKRRTSTYPIHDKSAVTLSVQNDTMIRSFITTRQIPRSSGNDDNFGDGGSTTYSDGGGTFGGDGGKF